MRRRDINQRNAKPTPRDVYRKRAPTAREVYEALQVSRFARWNPGKQVYEIIEGRIVGEQREKPEGVD